MSERQAAGSCRIAGVLAVIPLFAQEAFEVLDHRRAVGQIALAGLVRGGLIVLVWQFGLDATRVLGHLRVAFDRAGDLRVETGAEDLKVV